MPSVNPAPAAIDVRSFWLSAPDVSGEFPSQRGTKYAANVLVKSWASRLFWSLIDDVSDYMAMDVGQSPVSPTVAPG